MDKYHEELDLEDIAVGLYFLAGGIENYFELEKEEGMPFYFCEGGDQIIRELYPYAKAIEQAYMDKDEDNCEPGVFYYEISEDLAARIYIELIDPDNDPHLNAEHPGLEEWQQLMNVLIDMWCKELINVADPILPQLQEYKNERR